MSTSNSEGYIKYKAYWTKSPVVSDDDIAVINTWRNKLYKLGLIGQYPDGIGFGNVSERQPGNQFLITGSRTGGKSALGPEHYALVTDYDFGTNQLWSHGLTEASSEALSHAAIYEASTRIQVVIHVHHKELWEHLDEKYPFTPSDFEYGTPAMAMSLKSLAEGNPDFGLIIMKGHQDGIISYGNDWKKAFELIHSELDRLSQGKNEPNP